MNLRWTLLTIAAVFNFITSCLSLYAFFAMFPKTALAYFLISLPVTIYCLTASPNKVLDTKVKFNGKDISDFVDAKLLDTAF